MTGETLGVTSFGMSEAWAGVTRVAAGLEVVGAGRRREEGQKVGRGELRQERGVARGDAGSRRRQAALAGCADRDPAATALVGQDEVARERGARLEDDDVAGR